jgi:hypothetical protein
MLTRLNTQHWPKDCLRLCGEMLCAKHVPNQVSKHFFSLSASTETPAATLTPRQRPCSHDWTHNFDQKIAWAYVGKCFVQNMSQIRSRNIFLTFSFYINACGHAHTPAATLTQLKAWSLKLETWNLKLETWNSKLETWNLKLETLNLKLETWNSKLETWSSKLETWNLKLETLRSSRASTSFEIKHMHTCSYYFCPLHF